jgi:hypothetical protein
MTQDEIYEMAHQAGVKNEFNYDFRLSIETFYKLATAKEREACAKVCYFEWGTPSQKDLGIMFAQAIRARGEA